MEPIAYEELFALEMNHGWYKGMRAITRRLLSPVVGKRKNRRVLDAGCGTGANLIALSEFGTTCGFDFSPLALNYARQRDSLQIARSTIEALPYSDNTFEIVTTFDVIYHRAVKDDERAIHEMARVLKPGGYLLVRVPAMRALAGAHDVIVHGARRYTREDLLDKLTRAGLSVRRMTYANSLLMPIIYLQRKLQSKIKTGEGEHTSDVGSSSGLIGILLHVMLTVESFYISLGGSFPAGVSLFALAHKP